MKFCLKDNMKILMFRNINIVESLKIVLYFFVMNLRERNFENQQKNLFIYLTF